MRSRNIAAVIRRLHSAGQSAVSLNGQTYFKDSYTNVTPKILSFLNKNLYNQKYHPLCLLKEKVVQFFYKKFTNIRGNPIFSIHDGLNPVISVKENFDTLLVPKDHPSRSKADCYYLNNEIMLRAHMTAHQNELIKMGFNNFLMVGDVYRRDAIDSSHYPVFHQLDAVRLLTPTELFEEKDDGLQNLEFKEKINTSRTKEKQEVYTMEATLKIEAELKETLVALAEELFGSKIQLKWVEAYFPFTHPSWELEIFCNGKWMEMLGCGIMEHQILENSGCGDRIGWAFGLGLERLAMLYYSIPDIRIFWSDDPGFHCQFQGKTFADKVTYKPVSVYPSCPFDVSFWVRSDFNPNDFYEIAREVCGDVVEQVNLIDKYKCRKTHRESYCFRVVYRSMFKTFTKEELRKIHSELEQKLVDKLSVIIR